MRQVYQYDPVVGYKFIPELKARLRHVGGGYLVKTNKAGFQSDREFLGPKNPETRRILLFGDSFTAGEGVSNGFRYSDCLERMLPGLEIYNYGLPASGTDQHYLLYQNYAKDIDHDLVIIAVFVENIRRVASRYRRWFDGRGNPVVYAKPYYQISDTGELELCGVPPQKAPIAEGELEASERQFVAATERFPTLKKMLKWGQQNRLLSGALANQDIKDRLLKLVGYQPIKEYDNPNNRDWLVMRAILEQWIRNHDRPVVVMPIPLFHHVAEIANPSSYQARLREAAASAGGHYFDPLEGMKRSSIAACREVFFEDGHLNKEGHRILAASAAPELSSLLKMQLVEG